MLQSANKLAASRIVARDGAAGHACDLCFDDRSWQVRHVIARIGGWLHQCCVAITPEDIDSVSFPAREVRVHLGVADVARCPALISAEPVIPDLSPLYWWALAYGSGATALPAPRANRASERRRLGDDAEGHLLTPRAIRGSRVLGWDGQAGHLDDVLVDDRTWVVRYVVVELHHSWNPRKVLVATEWVATLSDTAPRVRLGLHCDRIKQAPRFDTRVPIGRPYEMLLHRYFGDPPAWMRGAGNAARDAIHRTGGDRQAGTG